MSARTLMIAILLSTCAAMARARADAIVEKKAMLATTIAEFSIDSRGVRVDLEIGPTDMEAFADLLPDEVYARVNDDETTAAERARRFLREGLVLQDEQGVPLSGVVEETRIRRRVVRDEVTGDPLSEQPADAELVLSVQLRYEFDPPPTRLTIQPLLKSDGQSSAATIGFVCYHEDLPVNDFRYLPALATLHLDWQDPWYSHFEHPNLRRQFDAPLSEQPRIT